MKIKREGNSESEVYLFNDYFNLDYSLRLQDLQRRLLEGHDDLKIFIEFLKEKIGEEEEIFALFNERPNASHKHEFSLDVNCLSNSQNDFYIKSQGRIYRYFDVILKFKKKKYFIIYAKPLEIHIYIGKQKRYRRREYEGVIASDDEQKVVKKYYVSKIKHDSDDDKPSLIYNHNNILSNMSCELKR